MTRRFTYSNANLSPQSERFKHTYKAVMEALDLLTDSGGPSLDLTFRTFEDTRKWRRRAYEYMNIVGVKFSTSQVSARVVRISWPGGNAPSYQVAAPEPRMITRDDEQRVKSLIERVTDEDTIEDEEALSILEGRGA